MKLNVSVSRWLAIGWLLTVLIFISLAFRQGAVFDSSIITLLPGSDQQPLVQQATDQMAKGFSRRLIVLLSGEDEEGVRTAVKSMATDLKALPGVSAVDWQVDEDGSRLRQELFPYRFVVLDQGVRERMLAGEYEQLKQKALMRLYSPFSIGGAGLIDDPFGLLDELGLNRKSGLNLKISNSLLKVTRSELPTYMLMVQFAGDPFSPALQSSVLGVIGEQKKSLSQSGISVRMSGMLIHAEAGARQARKEISTIGIGSLLGITLVMLFVFYRLQPLLLVLLSVAVGCVTAAAVTMLIFEHVHLVTFAFGAGLVGVSIDYALHFLCERSVTSAAEVLRKILPGLLLGLFSSVMAYSALALTPFPGLQQMAAFSVVGLVASWLTVVLWLPLLTRESTSQSLATADWLDDVRKHFPRLQERPLLVLLLAILFALAVNKLWHSDTLDDVRLLQTSPAGLLAEEKKVQQALGVTSSSQFLLVTADTLEQCLQKEEVLAADLVNLKQDGLLKDFQALSLLLPSLKRQQENAVMVSHLYEKQLKSFYDTLNLSENQVLKAQQSFVQGIEMYLTPADWLQQQSSQNWRELIVANNDESTATVIRFTGTLSDQVKQTLKDIAGSVQGVTYVDRVKNISDLMANYRTQIIYWIAIAYFCVLIILLYRYKYQVWRIVLPPLLASVFSLAIVSQLEQGLNLFHLMALILVLGIGLDMGIFLMETEDAPYTWLAVSLSAYTSLLAFGMLAWSDTPVLHHFGLTVLSGLAFVWLLTPLMRKTNSGELLI